VIATVGLSSQCCAKIEPKALSRWLKDGRWSGHVARPAGDMNGWLNWCRRLSKDYEVLPQTSAAFIYIANIRIMLRRLA